jgi:hypothetical protein
LAPFSTDFEGNDNTCAQEREEKALRFPDWRGLSVAIKTVLGYGGARNLSRSTNVSSR